MTRSAVDKIILIGASTGGPGHLRKIVQALDETMNAAIVIAQHMEAAYMPSFAKQMDELCALEVRLVTHDTVLENKNIYICSGTSRFEAESGGIVLRFKASAEGPYNPNIDTLFESSAAIASTCSVLGVILTGIGEDGAMGCRHLAEAGGSCVAECETSAVVYGMPKRAYELNPSIDVEPLEQIIAAIRRFGAG